MMFDPDKKVPLDHMEIEFMLRINVGYNSISFFQNASTEISFAQMRCDLLSN